MSGDNRQLDKLERALRREARKMQFAIYLLLARLYLEKLVLQARGAYLRFLRFVLAGTC